MTTKPFCFIASPFAGEGVGPGSIAADVARNLEFAQSICRRVALETALIPFAPHLVFPSFLRDHDPAERDLGIGYAKKILPLCTLAIFAVPYWREEMSSGMKFEEVLARELGVRVCIGDEEILPDLLGHLGMEFPRK